MKKTSAKNFDCKGFTLIEVALAILIIGLIMTPLLALYAAQHKQRMINESVGRLNDIALILDNYAQNNDRYPVPASFLTSQADPEHGMEGVTPDICPDVTTNGFCLVDRGTATTDDDILIGAIPFAALRMEADLALDSWGNKILYAVARVQTDAATFNISGSNTIIETALDPTTNLPITKPNAHDIFLVSLGEKGKGAYSADGFLVADCIEIGNPEYEDENCNFTDTFLSDENKNALITAFGLLDYGTRAFVEGVPEYYDDVTKAIRSPLVDQWNENINDPLFVTTIKNRIGIGEGAINPQHGLDVDGDILIEGNLTVRNVCTESGDCFRPIEIYGEEPDMDCDKNAVPGVEPVVAIGTTTVDTQVFCGSTIDGSGDPVIDQLDDGGNRWGSFNFNGITFENTVSGNPTDCSATTQNLTSITGTGIGTITCITPF